MLDVFKKKTFFDKLKAGLAKTRDILLTDVDDLILGERKIDQELFDELEEVLIRSDIGPAFTYELIEKMKEQVRRKELSRSDLLKRILRETMKDILSRRDASREIPPEGIYVMMVVGVNGTGKTTTIGKIAYELKNRGERVLLVAADTFRAAAIEQLETWSRRAEAALIKQRPNADPAAVVFDAVQAAKAGKGRVIIIDTAGRLHTKLNLMEELKKMRRIVERELPGAPQEILLVVDATTGQNGLMQAKMFKEEIGVTGIVLTKLDGTAKGGIVVRIVKELDIPIRYVGVGEGLEDLQPFDGDAFVDALFGNGGH
ncbi:MAG: signal recognition particle-docking protein FtsY [Syntrophobacterales bacterium]|nr:signal recognition particle-docking protein FtsY [Syntrophobacterales bacterium]